MMLHAAGRRARRRLGGLVSAAPCLVAGMALSACGPTEPGPWNEGAGHRWRVLAEPVGGDDGFTPMPPRRTGVDFENPLSREAALERDHLLIGSGVAVGDYDADGRPDLYFSSIQGNNALYRNLGGWRFEDVTAEAGVAAPGRAATGAVFADVDGDGDLDLLVTALVGSDALYLNDGHGGFTDGTDAAGLTSDGAGTTATFADIDGDGDLDLYVARYKAESAADVLRPYERPSLRLLVDGAAGPELSEEAREHFRLEMRRGGPVPVERAEPDRLLLNDGAGRFTAASWTDGRFRDAGGAPLERAPDHFGLAARFYDVDGDGDPDLYVCDDFDDPDHFWINDGAGSFTAAAPFALRSQSHASMAVDFADIDRDGRVDFFVADMLSPDPARRLAQVPLHAMLDKPPGLLDDRPQVGRNTLFLARGNGSWAQIAEMAGVDGTEWSWGSLFLDVDLDGWEDLLVANGHGRDMQDGDALDRISGLRGSLSWREAKSLYPERPTANRAFRNRGDLTFEDVSEAWRFGLEEDVTHGVATGDLDGDGDLDVVMNRLRAGARLLRNDARASRVAVRLAGRPPNRAGVGARVRLHGGAVALQEREVTAGGLYLSSAEPLLSFAAGAAAELELEVLWRSGSVSRIREVRPGRLYEVHEDGAEADAAAPAGGAPPPHFDDVSARLGHAHAEDPFDDFARQPLLPYRLSRLGPGLTWTDADRDGDPDLVVPGARGSATTLLRNDGGTFTPRAGAAEENDRTTALPVVGPRGTVDLLVARTSYDASTPEAARALSGVGRIGAGLTRGVEPIAAAGLSSVGPLAQADLDGDGDLDVFVGGRTVPAFHPLPASSRVLWRSDDGYRERPERVGDVLDDLGLVSGAVFTDVDDDGDPDLVLALEWGPLTLLLNEGGRLVPAGEAWGLAASAGLWRGVTAGDLDGDGRMDLVATNEGHNTRLRTSDERPLTLVHGDPDRSGSWDIVLARARVPGGPLHPLLRYELARAAIPSLRARVPDYASYAHATVEEVLGAGAQATFRLEAQTLSHTLFLNRGGRFEARALPLEAQLAPAHHAGVADLDGDGHEDILLTQNFFPTDGYTPRWDAGVAVWLRGDGRGGLQAVPAASSGLVVWGDQRGAALADFDADGRVDVAIGQNGAATRLFHNRGARSGLRVRLLGGAGNPDAIGALLRLRYDAGEGPAREVRSGGGYLSVDDPVQVLGLAGEPRALLVRWPDGSRTEVPLEPGAREVVVRAPPS